MMEYSATCPCPACDDKRTADRDEYFASVITRKPCTREGYHYIRTGPFPTAREAWDSGFSLFRTAQLSDAYMVCVTNWARAYYQAATDAELWGSKS